MLGYEPNPSPAQARVSCWYGAGCVLAAFCAPLLMLACTEPEPAEPVTNSESHWLRACDEDADCLGAGQCICNVCTAECDPTRGCTPQGDLDALCLAPDARAADYQCQPSATPPAHPICLPTCDEANTCPVPGSSCVEGACVTPTGCTLDTWWAPPEPSEVQLSDIDYTIQLEERGSPGEIALRLCRQDAQPIGGPFHLTMLALDAYEGQDREASAAPLSPQDPCTLWLTLPTLQPFPTTETSVRFQVRLIEPEACVLDYDDTCTPQVGDPCGQCTTETVEVARTCRAWRL